MPRKPIITKTTLVIVESPAKCKKIEEYLGAGYKCMASFGHLREITSLQNIEITTNYSPKYTIIDQPLKKKQIELLKKEIQSAGEVILACDADREGESICFHLCELFGLSITKTKRIIFHEITETAIQHAILHPTIINMNLVQAQQARQILDILVGFKISPLLWKYITKQAEHSLSAGRCQTPALKIIYENHQQLNRCEEEKVYQLTGYFTNLNLPFVLNKEFKREEEVTEFLFGSLNDLFEHRYSCSKSEKKYRLPPEPFMTSTLQQKASNEFHYSPKETMKIAQSLYEAGYITYMRTDCTRYSKTFVNSVKEYIQKEFEEKYIGEEASRSDDANIDSTFTLAHEAIRPTEITLKILPSSITDVKQRKLYECIWTNTLESCMASSSYYSISAKITAFNNGIFNYISEQIDFPGWKIVTKKYIKENKEFQYLQTIAQDCLMKYKKIISKATFKNTKSHYTEARLVQILEEKGIGRPSTFSSIVDKIQEREYVKKENIKGKKMICKEFELEKDEVFETEKEVEYGNEKNKLVIQPLGIIVMEFLEKHFSNIFNYDYTRKMETELDIIAKGEKIWYELCEECDKKIDEFIKNVKDAKEEKIEYQIDEKHFYVVGKYGPVIKCIENEKRENSETNSEIVTFKKVKKDIDLMKLKEGKYILEDVLDNCSTIV